MSRHRIALIHATAVAVEPIARAFAEAWPEAELMNLLEDALPQDRSRYAAGDPDLTRRFAALVRYAELAGASAVLFTCSAFGQEIDAARRDAALPVLKPNEAMFAAALRHGARIGLLATFEPAMESLRAELTGMAQPQGTTVDLQCAYVPDALDALKAGDEARHDELIVKTARSLRPCDVVVLAQFSMASARARVELALRLPTLSSPGSAVEALRTVLATVPQNVRRIALVQNIS